MSITRKAIVIFLLFLSGSNLYSQQNGKENPVLFAELFLGGAVGGFNGFLVGGELNSQINKNLFTLRYSGTTGYEVTHVPIGILPFPIPVKSETLKEFSVLVGQRYIKGGHSTSFSVGPSYNFNSFYNVETEERESSKTVGLALEANIKWFKREKQKYKISYFIPVGNPTAFGHSIGFKLSGNISQKSYVGLSLIAGFGWHKVY